MEENGKGMQLKTKCSNCGSRNVVKKGKSRAKFAIKQIYKCKDCSKRFVFGSLHKSYPAKIIMDSITTYNLGNNLAETSKIIKKKHKIKVPEKTIYSWIREFNKICSYYRIRDKAVRLFKPKDAVSRKIFRLFAILIYYCIKNYLNKIQLVIIDNEYEGREEDVKRNLLRSIWNTHPNFNKKLITFSRIGKKSNAHLVAYQTFVGKLSPNKIITKKEVEELI